MYHVKMDLICIICAVLLPMNMLSQAPRKKKKYPRLFGQILKLTDKRWDRFLDTKILSIQPGCGENRVSLNTSLSVEWSLFVLFVQMKTEAPWNKAPNPLLVEQALSLTDSVWGFLSNAVWGGLLTKNSCGFIFCIMQEGGWKV